MSTNEQTPLSQPTSVVRNTLGREQAPQNLVRPIPDEDLRENPKREKKPQGKVGTQGCPNQIHKPRTEARPFQIAKGEGSREKDSVQKIGEREAEMCYQSSRSKETEIASEKHRYKREYSRRTEVESESEGSAGGHWKAKPKKQKSSMKDDLSQPWVCEETDPFTPRIHYLDFPKTRMPSHIKTYDGSEDPEDHLKIFQAAAKTERWAMPTWCHMFNSTLTGNARSMDEMISVTVTFLRGEMAASNRERKKSFPSSKQETEQKQNFKRGNFRNEQRLERKRDRFTLLTKTPREILALDKEKFKPPPLMITSVEKKNASKFCEFHGEVGHTTDECMHLKRQIEEMLKAGKLSHLIKELKQNNGKDQSKTAKKGETSGKDKPLEILMWRNNMASGADIVASKDRRRGILNIRSDEFHGGEITLSLQRDYRKAGGRKIRAIPSTTHRMIKFPVAIHPEHPEQTVAIGSTLTEEGRKKLCGLLRRHLDVFAWKPADMTRVPRHIAEHRLNVRKGCLLVRQKKRGQALERNKAISEELENVRGFQGFEQSMPQRWLPLPEIDWKVESLCGYPYKCFLDAYKGYHQIKMAEEDEEKTSFITSQGIFCYSKMLFGLKNAEATYQRLTDKAFQKQIGRNLEVYVDDLVIKSRTEEEVIRDAEETFKTLQKINMKLNPKKCAFGMMEGTFLGYKVDANGLRMSPDKMKAVIDLPSPKCLKDVQKLNGKLAKEAFKEMKQSIAELPMLTAPKEKEELIIYLAAAKGAISAVLMTERDGKQVPIYFVSRALQGPEVNYTLMEKLILALVSASKRLKRYFKAHTIVVITDQPIKQLLSNPEVTGRLLKWRFELREHDIEYQPRTSVKGQILADFIMERPKDGTSDTPMEDMEELLDPWILFTDGSSCVDGSGAGLIIMNPEWMEFTYALRFRFNATNNEAEYEALIAGLQIASQMGIQNLQANVDSKLVANQVNEIYIAKESSMVRYLEKVKILASTFKGFSIKQIPRGENKKADALSKITSTSFAHLSKQVLVKELREKAIDKKEVLAVVVEEGHTWMTPVYEYLTEGVLPEEKKKARNVRRKAGRYVVISEVLYKKFSLAYGCGPDKVKFLIVAMDYFTKWIEAKPVASIIGAQVKKFMWDNIVCRSLREGTKARLGEKNKNWVEEVSHVLWAHHTMIMSSNGETSFSLTYGTEAVIPAEIGMPTLRTIEVDVNKNNEALGISLDLLEEKREQAAIQEVRSKARMEGYYNARVRSTSFRPGDLVYQNNEASHM
nr:reverse transcriptase domain-containing protein [Tanacetum cinerariifolium]